MKDFVKLLLEQSAITSVKSYIQSGNFIVNGSFKNPTELSDFFTAIILKNYGYNITSISFTIESFDNILKNYPFLPEDKRDYISFLNTNPSPEKIAVFIEQNKTADEFKIDDTTIYVKYATKYSDSKLNNNYFEKKLKVSATTRNLNTVNKLIEIANSMN